MSVETLQLMDSATPTTAYSPTPTPSIGGARGSTVLLGTSISELLVVMAAALAGGGARSQYAKFFVYNPATSDDLIGTTINRCNSLDDAPSSDFVPSVQSDSASDGTSLKARFIGLNTLGQPLQSERIMAGTTLAAAADHFSKLHAVEFRAVSSGVLTAPVGTVTVRGDSTVMGIQPAGYYSMTSEVKIAMSATLDDEATADDAATAPGGYTFTKPRTIATGIACPNGGVLTHLTGWGGFMEWTVDEARKPSPDLQVLLQVDGSTF